MQQQEQPESQSSSTPTVTESLQPTKVPRLAVPLNQQDFWKRQQEARHSSVEGLPAEQDWLLSIPNTSDETKIDEINQPNTTDRVIIPRIIHKIYIQKMGGFPSQEEMNEPMQQALKSWVDMNPTYRMQFFDLERCRAYLAQYFHPIFLRAFDCLEAFALKADFMRQVVVYREGGWYSDWKQVCLEHGALDSLAASSSSNENDNKNITLVMFWDHNIRAHTRMGIIQNALFGAVPRHPLMMETIVQILRNIQATRYGQTPIHNAGPGTFGEAYGNVTQRINLTDTTVEGLVYRQQFRNPQKHALVLHKCDGCGQDQNWDRGNNYNELHKKQLSYCQDAPALFAPPSEAIRQGNVSVL